ncbi:uncharacterized protein LOC127162327 isoform X3 [Labeo rohita]|uniref:uncharacterized protein LOC127162327 isoform X3 n=1 Tax=Labeo rohita TaxID=84645 RepID=UPI0021E2F16B|nr:uncharacterized protein LOC127162327 isoform X3 [Labeo rohita]
MSRPFPEASSEQMNTHTVTEMSRPFPEASSEQCHKHDFVHTNVSCLDKCRVCMGSGISSFKWIGVKCKDEIQLTDTEDDADGESACASALSKPKEISASTSEACLDGVTGKAGHPDTTRKRRIQWSKAEVAAVLKHFKHHIAKGHLASKSECLQCKNAEEPVLKNRSVQNIRDFVRNRGVTLKRRSLTVSSSES